MDWQTLVAWSLAQSARMTRSVADDLAKNTAKSHLTRLWQWRFDVEYQEKVRFALTLCDSLGEKLRDGNDEAAVGEAFADFDHLLCNHCDLSAKMQRAILDDVRTRYDRIRSSVVGPNHWFNRRALGKRIHLMLIDVLATALDDFSIAEGLLVAWAGRVLFLNKCLRSEVQELVHQRSQWGKKDVRWRDWRTIIERRVDGIFGLLRDERDCLREEDVEDSLTLLVIQAARLPSGVARRCVSKAIGVSRREMRDYIADARISPAGVASLDRDLIVRVCTELFYHALLSRVRGAFTGKRFTVSTSHGGREAAIDD